MARRTLVWVVTLVVVAAIGVVWTRRDRAATPRSVTLFSRTQAGCAIVIPADANDAERRAAEMLRASLAKASGYDRSAFRIVAENAWSPRRGIFVGATQRAGSAPEKREKPPYDTQVGWEVKDRALIIRSERRESVESAANWFLETQLGARWFMPGPLGEVIPHRAELTLAEGGQTVRPGFISRDLGLDGGALNREWYGRSRLEARFDHGHNLANIFRPEDFKRTPEMAPMRNGARFIPSPSSQNWQPNLLSPAAVQHAADVASRAFAADPKRLSFSLSANDTDAYDDSAETLAAVSPARFFRHRPDYSNLVFRFANAVAAIVAKRHPDRWLPTYAYYWTENTPTFPVARNVVPFLTADRSRWSFPEFAAEDKALIERWCRSGAEIVGVYDYFYGSPFLVPRPTIYTVQESIPFHYGAGVRAFFAETNPNWALDGPKPWLAAQLLWDPKQSPDALLDIYFREFWGEAEPAMREFFAICERVWRAQAGPPLWLRFFKDEDQSWIYPPAARTELRTQLSRAAALARSEAVRARVAFVSAGLTVSEAYWTFGDARARLGRAVAGPAQPAALLTEWKTYRAARERFVQRYAEVQREHPLALAAQEIEIYLRNQPDSRVAREVARAAAGRESLDDSALLSAVAPGITAGEIARVTSRGVECLQDPEWRQVVARPVDSSAVIDWTPPGAVWRGSSEAWEGRQVALLTGARGQRVLRVASGRTEEMSQWAAAMPGAVYAAQVRVRARTSPGTATYLVVTFLDDKQRHINLGRSDRLPPDAAVQETELCVITKAPPEARWIGISLRVLNQINDDFAEFSEISLKRLAPE